MIFSYDAIYNSVTFIATDNVDLAFSPAFSYIEVDLPSFYW